MPLKLFSFVLGPLSNNSYLLGDPKSRQAVVIDPSYDANTLIKGCNQQGWTLSQIWLTHAHFDHTAGVRELLDLLPGLPVYLHADDLDLYRTGGGAGYFGMRTSALPEPAHLLTHQQILPLGEDQIQVRHVPGHTPGHVLFYLAAQQVAFCGDLIFQRSVGRTDLPGGDSQTLLNSIRSQVFTLPPETRLLCGHGPSTSVGEEQNANPFVTG